MGGDGGGVVWGFVGGVVVVGSVKEVVEKVMKEEFEKKTQYRDGDVGGHWIGGVVDMGGDVGGVVWGFVGGVVVVGSLKEVVKKVMKEEVVKGSVNWHQE